MLQQSTGDTEIQFRVVARGFVMEMELRIGENQESTVEISRKYSPINYLNF